MRLILLFLCPGTFQSLHRRVPGAGSFLRPSTDICYGKSFLAALRAKYVEAQHGSESQELVTLGSSQGAIHVEAVNLDKIRGKLSNLSSLREVSLDGEEVANSEPPGTIHNVCPSECWLAVWPMRMTVVRVRHKGIRFIQKFNSFLEHHCCDRERASVSPGIIAQVSGD